jgi:hypothetical protein
METVIVSKFIKTLGVVEEIPTGSQRAQTHKKESDKAPSDAFKTGKELMYGGQGKNMYNNNLTTVSAQTINKNSAITSDIATNTYEGLDQPRLDETNAEVTGDDKRRLRIQNKRRKQQLRAAQPPQSHWTVHGGQVAYNSTPLPRTRESYRNSMCPTGRALNHPAADTLREWATLGCPTRTGCNWSKSKMWEAVEREPHRSATSPEALTHFNEEIKEKLRTHQARLVPWRGLAVVLLWLAVVVEGAG